MLANQNNSHRTDLHQTVGQACELQKKASHTKKTNKKVIHNHMGTQMEFISVFPATNPAHTLNAVVHCLAAVGAYEGIDT